MTIENRMICDYESCTNSMPASEVMPSGWVYIMTQRVPFGVERECHFCSVLHASIHAYDIKDVERAADEVTEVSAS